jgi:chemotaxis family two-component system response regulator Rcp1
MRDTFRILVIEDNEPDYVLLEKALNLIEDIDIEVFNAKNGQEGLDYVFKEGKYSECITPDMIILDLNLPIKNGFEVLRALKDDPLYKVIPVVVYSTSDDKGDICSSYSLYANSYITKTFDIQELFIKIKHFGSYWIKAVNLPDSDQCCIIKKEIKE